MGISIGGVMKQFKTYNDKDYETDSSCVLFQDILIFLICPPLLILLPFIWLFHKD